MQVLQSNSIPSSALPHSSLSHSNQYREAKSSLIKNPLMGKVMRKNISPIQIKILAENRKIKPKMFTKVANWMEKITVETLQFSFETLQIALRIIINFLNKVDEAPSNLQLLACVSLHLASKVNEPKIVAIASYMECCMNIFNREKFEEKENQVYQALQFKIQMETVHKIWNILEDQCQISSEHGSKWRSFINSLLKDPKSYLIRLEGVAIHLLLSCQNQVHEVEMADFLEKAQSFNLLH